MGWYSQAVERQVGDRSVVHGSRRASSCQVLPQVQEIQKGSTEAEPDRAFLLLEMNDRRATQNR
jgi:hypothetical protein